MNLFYNCINTAGMHRVLLNPHKTRLHKNKYQLSPTSITGDILGLVKLMNVLLSKCLLFYTNIDQILVNSLHGLLNYEIVGGLDCQGITT